MGAWQRTLPDEESGKEQVPPQRERVKQRQSLFVRDDDGCAPELDVVRHQLSCDRDTVNALLFGNKCSVTSPLWCDGDVVRYPLLSDRDVLKCPLSCDTAAVHGAVRRVDVKNSVLCNAGVKEPHTMGTACYERGDPACCDVCRMRRSLTCQVLTRRRSAAGEPRPVSCDDCAAVKGGGPRVKYQDWRANWRRRQHSSSVVWWSLVLLLVAAPLTSGQLRPKTDISSSRAEGGKLYVYVCCAWQPSRGEDCGAACNRII
jgi:hypothetical protein